jgi:hypothetical protein
MCDYSLHSVKSRPAKIGDRLTTRHFNTGTRGFAAPEDASTAVCVRPGTELAFANAVRCSARGVICLEGDYRRSYDGHLPAGQQGQPANTS